MLRIQKDRQQAGYVNTKQQLDVIERGSKSQGIVGRHHLL